MSSIFSSIDLRCIGDVYEFLGTHEVWRNRICFEETWGSKLKISYEELWRSSVQLAKSLQIEMEEYTAQGIAPSELKVCSALSRGADWYRLFVACSFLGVPLVSMSLDISGNGEQLQRKRNEEIVETLQPEFVVLKGAQKSNFIEGSKRKVLDFEDLLSGANHDGNLKDVGWPPGFQVSEDSVLAFHFTSGTVSGKGKCVKITHGMMIHELTNYWKVFEGRGTPQSFLQNSSLFWPAAVYGQMNVAVAFGGRVVCLDSSRSPGLTLESCILDFKLDTVGLVPSLLKSLDVEKCCTRFGGPLERLITWAESLPGMDEVRPWMEEGGVHVTDILVATEYWLHFYCHLSPALASHDEVTYCLIDSDNVKLDASQFESAELGELCLRGKGVSPGYVGKGSESFNDERFRDGWYYSRDVMKRAASGAGAEEQLQYVGRCDALTKVGGKFVSLTQCEERIREALQGSVSEVVVAPAGGEGVGRRSVWLVLSKAVSLSQLSSTLQEVLPGHSIEDTHVVTEIPRRSASGKVDLHALLAVSKSPFDLQAAYFDGRRATARQFTLKSWMVLDFAVFSLLLVLLEPSPPGLSWVYIEEFHLLEPFVFALVEGSLVVLSLSAGAGLALGGLSVSRLMVQEARKEDWSDLESGGGTLGGLALLGSLLVLLFTQASSFLGCLLCAGLIGIGILATWRVVLHKEKMWVEGEEASEETMEDEESNANKVGWAHVLARLLALFFLGWLSGISLVSSFSGLLRGFLRFCVFAWMDLLLYEPPPVRELLGALQAKAGFSLINVEDSKSKNSSLKDELDHWVPLGTWLVAWLAAYILTPLLSLCVPLGYLSYYTFCLEDPRGGCDRLVWWPLLFVFHGVSNFSRAVSFWLRYNPYQAFQWYWAEITGKSGRNLLRCRTTDLLFEICELVFGRLEDTWRKKRRGRKEEKKDEWPWEMWCEQCKTKHWSNEGGFEVRQGSDRLKWWCDSCWMKWLCVLKVHSNRAFAGPTQPPKDWVERERFASDLSVLRPPSKPKKSAPLPRKDLEEKVDVSLTSVTEEGESSDSDVDNATGSAGDIAEKIVVSAVAQVVGLSKAAVRESKDSFLLGLESLKMILLLGELDKRIRKRGGEHLGLEDLTKTQESLPALVMRVEEALLRGGRQLEAPHEASSELVGRKFSFWSCSVGLWKDSPCDWMFRVGHGPPGAKDEDVVKAILLACQDVVRAHPPLRSYPKDSLQLLNDLAWIAGLFSDFPQVKEAARRVWPRIEVREVPDVDDLDFHTHWYDRRMSYDVPELSRYAKRKAWFTPPVTFNLLLPGRDVPEPDREIFLYVRMTHLFGDGYGATPLAKDLAAACASRLSNEPHAEFPLKVKDTFRFLESRLLRSLKGERFLEQHHFNQQCEERGASDPCHTRMFFIDPQSTALLSAASHTLKISTETLVLGVLLISIARVKGWEWVPLSLMNSLRDEPGALNVLGFLSDYRMMGDVPCHEGSTVLHSLLWIAQSLKGRKWTDGPFRGEVKWGDERHFPISVNLIPAHGRRGQQKDMLEVIPTHQRLWGDEKDGRSSFPALIYIEELLPGKYSKLPSSYPHDTGGIRGPMWALRMRLKKKFFGSEIEWWMDFSHILKRTIRDIAFDPLQAVHQGRSEWPQRLPREGDD